MHLYSSVSYKTLPPKVCIEKTEWNAIDRTSSKSDDRLCIHKIGDLITNIAHDDSLKYYTLLLYIIGKPFLW